MSVFGRRGVRSFATRIGILVPCAVLAGLACAGLRDGGAARDESPRRNLERYEQIEFSTGAGWVPVGAVVTGRLRPGDSGRGVLNVNEPGLYAILAACDDHCSEMRLTLSTRMGRLLDADASGSAAPRIRAWIELTQPHELRLTMHECTQERCGYAYRVYRCHSVLARETVCRG